MSDNAYGLWVLLRVGRTGFSWTWSGGYERLRLKYPAIGLTAGIERWPNT